MKCVCTRPLVDSPQMKKVPKSSQKVGCVDASRSATNGVRQVTAGAAAAAGAGVAEAGSAP